MTNTDQAPASSVARLLSAAAPMIGTWLICIAVLGVVFLSVFVIPYAHHDQYRHFRDPGTNAAFKQSCTNDPQYQWLYYLARPIAAEAECVIFEHTTRLSDLIAFRFWVLALLALAATCYAELLRRSLSRLGSVALSLAIFTLPGAQNAIFMTNLANALAPLLATISYLALDKAQEDYGSRRRFSAAGWAMLASALLLAALLTYPFLALFFLCATMARLLFAPARTWRHQALLLVRDGLFFGLAGGVYWRIAKFALFSHDAATIASLPAAYRATLSFSGAIAKLGGLPADILGRVLALWFLDPSRVSSVALELIIGVGLLLYLCRGSRETDPSPLATRVVTVVGVLGLLLAVNSLYLLTAAFFLYRLFFTFSAAVVLLVVWGIAQIGGHSGISNLLGVRNGPAWAAIGMSVIACSVTCIDTSRNALNSYLEFEYVKAQIAGSPERTTLERIHIVQPRSLEFGFNGRHALLDEFNRPTTNYKFDLPNLVRLALVEMQAPPKYIVDGRTWIDQANGRACRIEPVKSGRLRVFREDGSSAEAVIQGDRIQSTDLRFNGKVGLDLKTINWSDGTLWGRLEDLDGPKSSPQSTCDLESGLAGSWASLDLHGANEILVTWSEPGTLVPRSPKMLVINMNTLLDSTLGWPASPSGPPTTKAFASSFQVGFQIANLNDGTVAAWGSNESTEDTYAGIEFPAARAVRTVRITAFSPENRAHLRDLSVVTADALSATPAWRVVRSRIVDGARFTKKVTMPPSPDKAVVVIEVDPTDPGAGAHKIWGISCFSRSLGYLRNYLPVGNGIYLRELQIQ